MTFDQIVEEIKADERNKSYTDKGANPIFQFNSNARILIVGQAPGRKAEESGIPFHDASGNKLMEWLGIGPDVFYSSAVAILPMDFYYPGKGKSGDLPPRPFMKQYHQMLAGMMNKVELKVLVGRYAIEYYLKEKKYPSVTETVRHYEEYLPDLFPIVHPSPLNQGWLKKNSWFTEETVPALQKAVRNALKTGENHE